MGKRGPTATRQADWMPQGYSSRWGNEGQPQLDAARTQTTANSSRWGNEGQPQRRGSAGLIGDTLADGETRANRNWNLVLFHIRITLADGETRANRNAADAFRGAVAL